MPTASEVKRLNRNPADASARAFTYRFLAEAFAYPEPEGWVWIREPATREALDAAVREAWGSLPETSALAGIAALAIAGIGLEAARADHLRAFGYTVRGACPPHEIEYGDAKADALFRPHRLADLSALYRAFGLEMDDLAHERQDHLAIECEFASILAARAAHALENNRAEWIDACERAWRLFLREHLGRWVQAFASRLEGMRPARWLLDSVALMLAVVRADCAALGIRPGSDDIQLVSYDGSDEAFCADRCGLNGAPTDSPPESGLVP
ncbi:MAG TPA: molecular chaperone TorD family protein [Verrucomicrobiae bacterium]|nr:molecular chaperone TorD family protein [Verrucomicrobiae bacterium]